MRPSRIRGLTAALGTSLWFIAFAPGLAAAGPSPGPTVDLNHASVAQLMELPGIGRTRAEAILHRRQQRPFQRVSDLLRVRGIGRRTYLRLKPYLRVGPPPGEKPQPPAPEAPSR